MDTLVLSSAYQPVARVPWQRAITMLWEGKVEVIEAYQDWTVRSVTIELKVPSIVRYLRHIRRRARKVRFSRENVYTRDHGRCQYCTRTVARPEATFDHVVPRSQGGPTSWENVVIACHPCNQRKGGRTPAQARMHLRTAPVRPAWLPDTLRLTFLFQKDTPPSWSQFLRDLGYWQGELEQDGG
jgi:5-methylcytosine-specific restriction endonuclease McrA